MKTIQHILARYTAFLWAILQPLGAWGVFAVAALDGAAVGLPIDVVVGGYVAQNHARLLLYVLMAATGSALGSLVIYAIGYKGGEELLRKRVSPERFEKLHEAFDKHPFWSLMFPAMLPPPTPFKLFALGAAEAAWPETSGSRTDACRKPHAVFQTAREKPACAAVLRRLCIRSRKLPGCRGPNRLLPSARTARAARGSAPHS